MTDRHYALHVQHTPHWQAHLTPLDPPRPDAPTPPRTFHSPLELLEWLEAQTPPRPDSLP